MYLKQRHKIVQSSSRHFFISLIDATRQLPQNRAADYDVTLEANFVTKNFDDDTRITIIVDINNTSECHCLNGNDCKNQITAMVFNCTINLYCSRLNNCAVCSQHFLLLMQLKVCIFRATVLLTKANLLDPYAPNQSSQ